MICLICPSEKHPGHIKYTKFIGIQEIGDFDAKSCTEKEWEDLKDTVCLYRVLLQHIELPSHLSETHVYKSWSRVWAAIHRRMKKGSA